MHFCGFSQHSFIHYFFLSMWGNLFLHLNHCNNFSHYCASLAYTQRKKEREGSQKIPILVTYLSGTLAILPSKVNGPLAHGSTIIPDMAH